VPAPDDHGPLDPDAGRAPEAAAALAANLADALADVVYALRIEPDLAFEYISPVVLQLTGYSQAEYYADPALAIENTAPQYRKDILDAFASEADVVTDFRVPYLRRDDRTIWTHHRCRKVDRPDGSVVVYAAARDVTAQVEAEAALARSQEAYRLLAENASDVVWRAANDGLLEWVSPSVTTVMGWSPADLVGRLITDFVHPDDLPGVSTAGRAAAGGDRVSFEARYRCRDGAYRWLDVTARPVRDPVGQVVGRVGSCRDMHAEIEARRALQRSEQRFRLAMESAPTGMAVLDLDGRFVEVNAELCRMVDRDLEWLLGHGVADIVHPQDAGLDQALRDAVLAGIRPAGDGEIRLRRRDESMVWAHAAIGLLREPDGTPQSLVAQFVNVTEAHEAREALRFMAAHDPLTHLLNRRELLARMSTVVAHAPRGRGHLAVLFADLDGLKEANDAHGHAVGDQLIIETARRLTTQVRDEDLTARLGGDEFVIVLPSVTSVGDALAVARKVNAAMAQPLRIGGQDISLGMSIGVAIAAPGDDATTLLDNADAALYRAKAAGRNRIELHSPAQADAEA
jgi:diguanylate cyclase (GGDEF)-like protein/PAS domain S-box-containing protein